MGVFHRTDTRKLTGTSFELSSGHWRKRIFAILAIMLLLGGSLVAGFQYFETQLAPARRVVELERENAGLRQTGDEARMALEMERATRAELERQVSELNQQVQQLNAELGFFRSQSRGR